MLACVSIGICALAVRTVQVQLLDGGALAKAAEAQQRVAVPLWAPRGPIVDRTGQTLALSYRAVTVGCGRRASPIAAPSRRRSRSTPTHAGRDRAAHGGERAVRLRRAPIDPST